MLKLNSLLAIFAFLTACAAPSTSRINYNNAEIDTEAALQRELAQKNTLATNSDYTMFPILFLNQLANFAATNKLIRLVLKVLLAQNLRIAGKLLLIKFLVAMNLLLHGLLRMDRLQDPDLLLMIRS